MTKRLLKTLISVMFITMMCATMVSSQVGRRVAAKGAAVNCDACHSVQSITAATSKYFEHYKTVHREVLRRNLSCSTCHSPFVNEVKVVTVRSSSCAACHSDKRGQRPNAASAHTIHIGAGVSCSSCHQAVKHKIDMLQLLNVCSNCH